VSLNTSATAIAVSALVNNITFEDTDTDNPTQSARTVRFMVSNGDGAFDYTGDLDPSMGISLFPEDVTEPDKLIGGASCAMHEAKRVAGKNNFQIFFI
jgi:GGDEF domain-containing protein